MTNDEEAVIAAIRKASQRASLPGHDTTRGFVTMRIGTDHLAEPILHVLQSMPRDVLLRALGMEFMSITVGSRDEERVAQMERGERPLGPYISWEGWVSP